MTTSLNPGLRDDLVDELGRVDPDVTYYALTLTASIEGQMQWNTQTSFVGNGSKRMWELRAASPVIAENMRRLWSGVGQRSIVVNSERALMFFMRAGGNAVIAEPLFAKWFGQLLDPVECVPSRLGEGVRRLDTAIDAELQHAPSRRLRMAVLKRDCFRCVACGQRPSEDVNIELHVHHVRPWGQGGLTEMHNLLTLCQTCHTGLDPHFDLELLTMVPDGLVAPAFNATPRDGLRDGDQNSRPEDSFDAGVRRYRERVAAELGRLSAKPGANK